MTLSNLYADGNGWWGVYLDNCLYDSTPDTCTSPPSNVTLTGTNVFTNNQYTGVTIFSHGTITTNNVTAVNNGLAGDPDDGQGAWLENFDATTAKAVLLNGVNSFNENNKEGLVVRSLGAITAKGLMASGNGGRGAYLHNQWGIGNYNILLSGKNTFNTNGSIGLEAYSNGNITMNNLTANDNHGGQTISYSDEAGGAYLDNWSTTSTPVNISLTGVNTFNGNGSAGAGTGLWVYTNGTITISYLTANDNQDYGAYLDSHTGTAPKAITLTGASTFVHNGMAGLSFDSIGPVNLTNVNANLNSGDGVHGTSTGTITITCESMVLNTGSGYDLSSGLTITLKGVYTWGNTLANISSAPTVTTRLCPLP